MVKAVLFDLDGTLYDYDSCNSISETGLAGTISECFGVSVDRAYELLRTAKSNVKQRLGVGVAASHNRMLYMQEICELERKNSLQYALLFYDAYWNCMLEHMELFDYVIPLFDGLAEKGIKIGIVTDLTAQIQHKKLRRLGLTNYVSCIVTSEEIGEEKPSEKMFFAACEKIGILPQDAIMIGDSMEKDVAGAKSIGMEALLFDGSTEFIKKARAILG